MAPTAAASARHAPDLAPLVRPIHSFRRHPVNARQGDVGLISQSLMKYGQTIPAVVQRSSGRIVKGNHTHMAAVSLGWDTFAFSVMDLTDDEAEGYLLMDNRTSDMASYDEVALAEQVRVQHENGNGDATGFDGDALDDLLRDTGEMKVDEKPYHHDQEGFLDRFLNTTIRQLSMHFTNDEYLEVIQRLDRVMEVAGVPSHTDAFTFLLNFWEVAQGDSLPELRALGAEEALTDDPLEDPDVTDAELDSLGLLGGLDMGGLEDDEPGDDDTGE